jgi:hypothetical protein
MTNEKRGPEAETINCQHVISNSAELICHLSFFISHNFSSVILSLPQKGRSASLSSLEKMKNDQ